MLTDESPISHSATSATLTIFSKSKATQISYSILAFILSLTSSIALSQTIDPSIQVSEPQTEIWFGWFETPNQQLRTILRVQRDKEGKATSGFLVNPDETDKELPLRKFQIHSDGAWQFTVENPIDVKNPATYAGMQSAADQVVGDFKQNGIKVPLSMRRVDSLRLGTRGNLGADSVWRGTLDMKFRKMDYRIRVYSKPPYATTEAPRLLFDSLSEKAIGIPTVVSLGENGMTTFDMKSAEFKFLAQLNEDGNELEGRFIRGPLQLPLIMKLQSDDPPSKKMPTVSAAEKPEVPRVLEEGSGLLQKGETPVPPLNREYISSAFFTESPFEVSYGGSKAKEKELDVSKKGIKLSGTVTLPKVLDDSNRRKFPAVIMLTGSGPQDRDETIGRHKPFQAIAHFLAENGIASLRFDDRGVDASTGDFLNSTSEDFAKDAVAVWKYAKTIPEIDPLRIGILGHSEGALVGPMAAVWEPGVAFLILLAPPGVTGSQILKSQIDRISELQGMSEADRKATLALQGKLQDIASGYFTDETTMRRDIQNAIKQNWDSLKSIALSQNPNVDLDQVRKDLTYQIEGQFQQLRMPWFRFFLTFDPTPNWMMLRCPTLALWGSNDVQVLPEMNRAKIVRAIGRNQNLEAQFEILPGLNHLLQTSKTGLPEEYEEIEETISPSALRAIRIWAEEQGLIER